MKEIYPGIALVLIVVLTWGGAWWRQRRFRRAIAELLPKLEGRFEPGSHTSGGTLFGRLDGRDIVFTFHRGSSARGPSTTAIATLAKPVDVPLRLKRREAVEKCPGLKRFSGIFGFGLRLTVESNQVSLEVPGVLRDARRILELGTLALDVAGYH